MNSTDYTKMMEVSKVSELDEIIDHPSDKRSKNKSEAFIKGKQDTLNDVLHLITNIITCAQFCTR